MRESTAPKGLQVRRFEKLLSCVFLSCQPPSSLCFTCCLGHLGCVLRVLFCVSQLTFYSLFPHSGRVRKRTAHTFRQIPVSTDNPAAGSIKPHRSGHSPATSRPRLPAVRFPRICPSLPRLSEYKYLKGSAIRLPNQPIARPSNAHCIQRR